MKGTNKYVGLDVHKDTTVIAVAEGGRGGEQRLYGTISSDLHALEKALREIRGGQVAWGEIRGGRVAWRLKRNSEISVSL